MHYERGLSALKANKLEEAALEFREVLRLSPTDVQARANLGVVEFLRGDWADAAANFPEWRQSAGSQHVVADVIDQDAARAVPQLEHPAGIHLPGGGNNQFAFGLEQSGRAALCPRHE